jgi:hypothetical protein
VTLPAPVVIPSIVRGSGRAPGPLLLFVREVAAHGVPGSDYMFPTPVPLKTFKGGRVAGVSIRWRVTDPDGNRPENPKHRFCYVTRKPA